MSVIGIDFGNNSFIIAQAKRGGVDIVLNESSARTTPTMVSFQGKQRYIGEAASTIAKSNFKNTINNLKRIIGRQWDEADLQEELASLPFKCIKLPNGTVGFEVMYNDETLVLNCEQVVAMILQGAKSVAVNANDGNIVSDCVISVPNWYTDSQRRAFLNACEIAELNCLKLMNESTAIALSYGIFKSAKNMFHDTEPQNVMFIDMGEASFSCTIASFIQGKLEVKASTYDKNLGGRDIDKLLAQHLSGIFKKKYNMDPLSNPKSSLKLLQACEKGKKSISPIGVAETNISVECLMQEYDLNYKLTLEEFEQMIMPLIERLDDPINQAMLKCGLSKEDITFVEVVGGGTRIPLIKKRVSDIMGLDKTKINFGLSTTLNADESVARGCALQCAMLSVRFKVKEFSCVNFVNYPIVLSWDPEETNDKSVESSATEDNEEKENQIDKNSIVIFTDRDDTPKTKRITFKRSNSFVISCNYDSKVGAQSPFIGRFTIVLPEAKIALGVKHVIRVNFRHDINGIFVVESAQLMEEINAEEKTEGGGDEKSAEGKTEATPKKKLRKVELQVLSQVYGMTKEEKIRYLDVEANMSQQDRLLKETAAKKNELETYVYNMRTKLNDTLQKYTTNEVKTSLLAKLDVAENWLYDEGYDTTKTVYTIKLKELTDIGDPIESRFFEDSNLPTAKVMLLSSVEEYRAVANSNEEKYAHLTDSDREKLRSECASCESWLYEQMNNQLSRQLYENPVITVSAINQRASALKNVCIPIANKPKPKPVPVTPTPEAKPTEAKQESKPSTEEKDDDKKEVDIDDMDVDSK